MGFLSGLSGILGGGSQQQSSSNGSSQSGFGLLPQSIQNAFSNYGTQVNGQLNGVNLTNMYTPLPQTAGETTAYNAINKGFAPDQAQLTSDINMQMNPYMGSVLDQIQKQAYGANSALKSATTAAGQYGSNRGALGANDIANTQADTIGSILGGQYNSALQNALTTLPQLREQSAQGQLGAAANQRQLYAQQQQAPIAGLGAIGSLLGALPQSGGSVSNTSSQSSGSSSQNGTLGNLFSTGAAIAPYAIAAFSDIRLKKNIRHIGEENGYPIYEFTYRHDAKNTKFVGVMAQDVEKIKPEAVGRVEGWKTVNYDMIGVKFREAA